MTDQDEKLANMTDEQFKIWAKSFLERTDTYSSWRGAAVEAIQMIEDERAMSAKLVEALDDLYKRHLWHPELGECICNEHTKACELLALFKKNQAPRKG